jgi:hypothetical protein
LNLSNHRRRNVKTILNIGRQVFHVTVIDLDIMEFIKTIVLNAGK